METKEAGIQGSIQFSEADQQGLYKAIFNRRDVRGQFLPDPVCNEALARILYAAHHAPSVGFMQPWNFVVIRSAETKQRIYDAFSQAHEQAAGMFDESKRETYRSLKLEGIREAPINLCITCDRSRSGPVVIGRTSIKTMDLYSSVCAVQNLWLAARAEGLGVGWVSIIQQQALQEILAIPKDIVPIAYLCLGHVSHFYEKPELETAGWLPRLSLSDLVAFDSWQGASPQDGLLDAIETQSAFPHAFMKPKA